MTDPKLGLIGFICPQDGCSRTFNYCVHRCQDRCKPLPLLLALMSSREPQPGIYHVTEILNPPQLVYLARNNAYFAAPDSQIWMTFGSAWHNVIEGQEKKLAALGMEKEWLVEQPFEREVKTKSGTALLRGTPDLYEVSRRRLWDFKTVKAYFVRKILDTLNWDETTYHLQLNIYRYCKFPEAQELVLECLIKDWSEAVAEKDGLKPIERLQVPVMSPEYIGGFIEATVNYHLFCQIDPSSIRPCSESEIWVNNKKRVPMRCLKYCPVSSLCPQWARYQEGGRVPRQKG